MPDIDPRLMQQLLETFRIQLEERLQAIADGLLALERTPDGNARKSLMEGIFRAAHNIKGAARGVGLERSAELAHAIESLFSALKRDEVRFQARVIDLCLAALDALRPLVDAEAGGQEPGARVRELLQDLHLAAAGHLSEYAPAAAKPAPAAPRPARARQASALAPAPDSVRLPVERLDRIADLAEELQMAKIRLDDHHEIGRRMRDLSGRLRHLLARFTGTAGRPGYPPGALPPNAPNAANADLVSDAIDLAVELDELAESSQNSLRTTLSRLHPIAAALRDDVRRLRMAPATTILTPLARTLRDLARGLGKDVELTLSGERIEMDRAILDALRDPLVHLLRNAVDHGIEIPTVRRNRGKPETGLVSVRLAQEGGQVHIEVADDGAGIDLDTLRMEARRQGLEGEEALAGMTQREVLDLIFRPGFSTRRLVSEVSGRGVGLDVVQVQLQSLNGRIAVDTEVGAGSRFRLSVPLTLAGDHGLLVGAAGQVFVIPSQYVVRILELEADDIVDLEAGQVIRLGGDPVPLRDLAALLHLRDSGRVEEDRIHVVVVNRGWFRAALRVDNVLGEREMVVRPLAPPLAGTRFIVGGTLGRDGDTLLVLDMADLLDAALGAQASGKVVARRRAEDEAPHSRILVVDDSITTRTLEQSILESAGYHVEVAADGDAAWEILRHTRFDLVITDVEMPGMNGFELTAHIKHEPRFAHLPVIIVTSLGTEEDRRRGMEARADAYIVKSSFESRELLDVVGQLI
ncbi:MAG: hybrid sensor histidine kinase/response regulator [Betaproteobacteria bacterium]|nr:hybrid sensor histidine kinase/response regulator [Betaproteobacteria bacterium]